MAETDVAEQTDQAGTTEQAAGQDEAQTEVKTDSEQEKPATVPYERFEEMVKTVEQLKEQAEVVAQQQALIRANPVQQQEQYDPFAAAGLAEDDDVPTVAQFRTVINDISKVFSRQLADVAFQQSHPDYAQLVGTSDEIASGQWAGPFAEAIKKNPALLADIARSANPRLAAYNIAKLQLKKPEGKTVTTEEAEAAITEAAENAKRVKSSSNAKGGAALSEAGRYKDMDDAEFLKLALSHGAII